MSVGNLFRAEVVNDEGDSLAHAKIQVEYLRFELGEIALGTTGNGSVAEELGDTFVFTDKSGSFAFIPPQEGVWTFTLVDGDNGKLIQGKKLEYDSSLSIVVK